MCSSTVMNVWVSNLAIEHEKFKAFRLWSTHACSKSDMVPSTLDEWLAHRTAVLEAKAAVLRRRMKQMEAARISQAPRGEMQKALLAILSDGRGAVLAQQTIWCQEPEQGLGGRPSSNRREKSIAAWPCREERTWEGDLRAKTRCRRFPPLPREPGNGTVVWHKRKAIVPYDFDRVRRVPSREEVSNVAADMKDFPAHYVESSLWQAISEGD